MRELIIAFGLLLFIEGTQLRTGGLIFALIGFGIIWYVKN